MKHIPNAMDGLKKWLSDLLFGRKENQLPIFGEVDSEKVLYQDLKFGKAQEYLINEYLSQKVSNFKVIQVSLALICYWYQNYNPNCFFSREQEYWKNMIEYLGIMFNYKRTHYLELFDSEGNWIGD
jgi:hypothetical protein